MNTTAERIHAAVRAADPAPVRSRTLDARARADLDAILASPVTLDRLGPSRRPARRRLALAGAAMVAALTVAGGTVALRDQARRPPGAGSEAGGSAATPPLLVVRPVSFGGEASAEAVLREIAARTTELPDDVGTGRYGHVKLQSWSLFTRIDGVQVTSMVVPQEESLWRAADGSGRRRSVDRYPTGAVERVDEVVPPGTISGMWPLGSLSDDDDDLTEQLEAGHPTSIGPAERLVAIADAYRETPIPPPVRAAMLRYLAATDDLRLDGEVTDRLGRTGVAVSVDSAFSGLPTRYTFIIDRDTGHLLGYEQMLTETAGKLDVAVPSVISYTAFVSAVYTDTTG